MTIYRRVHVDRRQRVWKFRRFPPRFQPFLLRRGKFADMLVHAVKRAVFLQQRFRRLFAYAVYPGNIIRFIAHQRFQIDDLRRIQPDFFGKIFIRQFQQIAHAFLRKAHVYVFVHQLIRIPVPRVNIRVYRKSAGKRSYQVVRFVPFEFHGFYAHQTQQFF